ncbi:GP46-like surface antigen, putative [Bodo saltans]|uniref:GP46-like surface antigen, putative n=1 Tax=Bodo saltans TaxID=75058 RepID=A0A0S4ITN3_BODSA|nr:GP46-like surface antigen, putative [Bodo saltans]|eukprot:CUF52871.1 GP46-like surface antigen, putative [Bodo saltans]
MKRCSSTHFCLQGLEHKLPLYILQVTLVPFVYSRSTETGELPVALTMTHMIHRMVALFLFSLLPMCIDAQVHAAGAVSERELNALNAFFHGLSLPVETNRSLACRGGVVCTSINVNESVVTELKFDARSLSGTLSPELSRLSHITSFNVGGNSITGSIPQEWSAWGASLATFNTNMNHLDGTLPSSFSNWTSLQTFAVYNNSLGGTLPAEYANWTQLTTFTVANNNLTGTLPNKFGNAWSNLRTFQVSANQLNWTLPESYQNMTKITTFMCDENQLTGTLPASYAKMSSMIDFFVLQNSFEGTLPPEYSAWGTTLQTFRVQNNLLSGTLPPEYAQWARIDTFYLKNNFFTGTLPPQYSSWTSLTRFTLRNNRLSGSLPPQYAEMTALNSFDVSQNALSGTLPSQYSKWGIAADQLDFSHNQFTQTLPETWTSMTRMRTLSVANNSLSGTISYFPNLEALSASFNNFSGTLPSKYLTFTSWDLRILDLQNNAKLQGPVPTFSLLVIASVCETMLCSSKSLVSTTLPICLPGLLNLDLSTVGQNITDYMQFANRNAYPLSTCTATTTSVPFSNDPSSAPDSIVKLNNSPRSVATTTFLAAAAAFASLSMDAADLQMLSALMSSPCSCNNYAETATSTTSGSSTTNEIMQIALSPFSVFGSPWAAIGNSLLCTGLIAVHVIVVWVALSRPSLQDNNKSIIINKCTAKRPRSKEKYVEVEHDATCLGRVLGGQRDERRPYRQELMWRFRFPNVSICVAMFFIPGIVRAVCDVMDSIVGEHGDTFAASPEAIGALTVSIPFVIATSSAIYCLIYRHVDHEQVNYDGAADMVRRGRQRRRSAPTPSSCHLHFSYHSSIAKTFSPIPRRVSRVVLPIGIWMPPSARMSYGSIVAKYTDRWMHAWCVVPLANIFVQIVSAIRPPLCNGTQVIIMVMLMCVSVFFVVKHPHRALLAAYLTSLALALNLVTTLMSMLCRLGVVSQGTFASFGLFVSVALMIMKLYHVMLPFVEQRFLDRNVPAVISTTTPNSLQSSTSRQIRKKSSSLATRNDGGSHRAASQQHDVAVMSPGKGQSTDCHQRSRQDDALRELISLIVNGHGNINEFGSQANNH